MNANWSKLGVAGLVAVWTVAAIAAPRTAQGGTVTITTSSGGIYLYKTDNANVRRYERDYYTNDEARYSRGRYRFYGNYYPYYSRYSGYYYPYYYPSVYYSGRRSHGRSGLYGHRGRIGQTRYRGGGGRYNRGRGGGRHRGGRGGGGHRGSRGGGGHRGGRR